MFDFIRNRLKSADDRARERLNAYVDGALSPRERSRFEARLAQDRQLRAEVAELQRLKRGVRALPRVRAPRSFTLDPAVYGAARPAAPTRLYPALRAATVLTAFFFVFSLALILAGGGTSPVAVPAADVAQIAATAPAIESAAESAAEAPVETEALAVEEAADALAEVAEEAAEPAAEPEVVEDTAAAAEEVETTRVVEVQATPSPAQNFTAQPTAPPVPRPQATPTLPDDRFGGSDSGAGGAGDGETATDAAGDKAGELTALTQAQRAASPPPGATVELTSGESSPDRGTFGTLGVTQWLAITSGALFLLLLLATLLARQRR